MIGGCFEASNDLNFNKKVTLFTIEDLPDCFVEQKVVSDQKYRYFRYIAPQLERVFIGEVKFYTGSNHEVSTSILGSTEKPNLNKITDDDLNTYYWAKSQETIVFDLTEELNVSKIQFAPRSDTNFVVAGNTYELFIWDKNEWVSCGEKIAASPELSYQKVPKGGLYLLRNLSGGTEERVFTYANGKQIWW